MKDTAIVICLHGDETFTLNLKKRIPRKIPVFIGNPLAVKKGIRYVNIDLNRAFPGKREGSYEERRAFYLLKKLRKFKYVLDIHSSSSDTELFGIITKLTKYKLELAKKLGLTKVVIMSGKFARGKSLIDCLKCAISLEIGPHKKKGNINKIIKIINNLFSQNENNKIKLFKFFKVINGENNPKFSIKNFKKVKKGDLIAHGKKRYYAKFDFIPIFIGEKAYKGILCIATKEVTQK